MKQREPETLNEALDNFQAAVHHLGDEIKRTPPVKQFYQFAEWLLNRLVSKP